MKRITKDNIAMGFLVLSVSLVPSAAIAEIGGLKTLTRHILWGSVASLGACMASIPGISKDHSKIWHREDQAKDYLYCRLRPKYPKHNIERFIRKGAISLRKYVFANRNETLLK